MNDEQYRLLLLCEEYTQLVEIMRSGEYENYNLLSQARTGAHEALLSHLGVTREDLPDMYRYARDKIAELRADHAEDTMPYHFTREATRQKAGLSPALQAEAENLAAQVVANSTIGQIVVNTRDPRRVHYGQHLMITYTIHGGGRKPEVIQVEAVEYSNLEVDP